MVSWGRTLNARNIRQFVDIRLPAADSDPGSRQMPETPMTERLRQLVAESETVRDPPSDELGRPRDPRPLTGVAPGSPLLPRPGATRLRRGSYVNSGMVAGTSLGYEPLPPPPPLDLVAHPPGFSLLPPLPEEIEIEDDEKKIENVVTENEAQYEAARVTIQGLQRVERERFQRTHLEQQHHEQQEQAHRERQEREHREQRERQECEQQERQQL